MSKTRRSSGDYTGGCNLAQAKLLKMSLRCLVLLFRQTLEVFEADVSELQTQLDKVTEHTLVLLLLVEQDMLTDPN